MTTLDTNGIVLTGDNNYSGDYNFATYGNFFVLGGANDGGHNDYDATNGNEVFMFGNLQYKGTTTTDSNYSDTTGTDVTDTSHTYQSTATGTSDDTLHFSFDVSEGQHFTFDAWNGLQNGNASYTGVENAYESWLAGLPSGYTLSDAISGSFQDGLDQDTRPPTPVYTEFDGFQHADVAGTGVTSLDTGTKTLLGFSVGSDHIELDNKDGSTIDYNTFNNNFSVTSQTHPSANGNTVNDTIISDHSGDWSVDLYGVDTTALGNDAQALKNFAWNSVISHLGQDNIA